MLTSTQIAHMTWIRLWEMPRKGKSTEKEGEELLRDGKRGVGGMGSQRGRGFFLKWWKCSKTDGGDDCPYLWIHVNTTEWYTLNRQIVRYMNYISVKVLVTQSCLTVYNPMDCSPPGSCPWNFPGKNTRVGCHFLLQGIFPTQGSNPALLHCRQILYHLSH